MYKLLIILTFWIVQLTPAPGWAAQAAGDPSPNRTDAKTVELETKGDSDAKPPDKANRHPAPPRPVPDSDIIAAIERAVAFLLRDQNTDGSWGSAGRTKDLNIVAGIGSHHAFRTAVTALCVSALIEISSPQNKLLNPDAVRRAIERGEEFLFHELPEVRRDEPSLIYNVWAHAYGIQALARMHARLPEKARRARIEELIRAQYDRLTRYESAEGGWGYYDMGAGTQRPNSYSCSFVNATVLVAFHEARQIGVLPPDRTSAICTDFTCVTIR
jgi:hypothetical protein